MRNLPKIRVFAEKKGLTKWLPYKHTGALEGPSWSSDWDNKQLQN
jgi:hypothetical protein